MRYDEAFEQVDLGMDIYSFIANGFIAKPRLSQLINYPPLNYKGPHNFVFPLDSQFSFSNYIKVIYTDSYWHSFSTADGSSDQLDLSTRTPSEFVMPEPDNVGKVTIHYDSRYNVLLGISVFDRKGNRLFKTCDK